MIKVGKTEKNRFGVKAALVFINNGDIFCTLDKSLGFCILNVFKKTEKGLVKLHEIPKQIREGYTWAKIEEVRDIIKNIEISGLAESFEEALLHASEVRYRDRHGHLWVKTEDYLQAYELSGFEMDADKVDEIKRIYKSLGRKLFKCGKVFIRGEFIPTYRNEGILETKFGWKKVHLHEDLSEDEF